MAPKGFMQDGADFYDEESGDLIVSYAELVKSDHDVAGAQSARERFLVEHPDFGGDDAEIH